jgi:cholesterol oxidase
MAEKETDYDYIVIGSGFGGAASALRLSEKGYKVLVVEKGRWLSAEDFPESNWNLKKWLWLPFLRFHGLFKITFFRHVTTLSGVGVGGGSLVYANTLPVPKREFFRNKSWAHLADWEKELKPFYRVALKMMGTKTNPELKPADLALKELARRIGKEKDFSPTEVAVFFGEPEKEVDDPFFGGEGPPRSGCSYCGGCMLGCRHNAKNTLDKNYLYLAQKLGCKIQAETKVYDVQPLDGKNGETGYRIKWRGTTRWRRSKGQITAKGIVFAGGSLGTTELLLKLKKSSLPNLSDAVGRGVRTNSESLIGVTSFEKDIAYSDGIAIGSILNTDEHSHIEPVRYPAGSGAWRVLMSPLVSGSNFAVRLFKIAGDLLRHPVKNFRAFFVRDWAEKTAILLFMQTLDSTLRFSRGFFGMATTLDSGAKPSSFIPEAQELANSYAEIVHGKATSLITEAMLGIPTTAHILGGAPMGKDEKEGVIDKDNRVFGYRNMYVCDGAAISANPGVNPSLSILAITERAMSIIPEKSAR